VILAPQKRLLHFDHVAHTVLFGHHVVRAALVEQQTSLQRSAGDVERRTEDLRAVRRIDRSDKDASAGTSVLSIGRATDGNGQLLFFVVEVGQSRDRGVEPDAELGRRNDTGDHATEGSGRAIVRECPDFERVRRLELRRVGDVDEVFDRVGGDVGTVGESTAVAVLKRRRCQRRPWVVLCVGNRRSHQPRELCRSLHC